jgi:hypothetical protein
MEARSMKTEKPQVIEDFKLTSFSWVPEEQLVDKSCRVVDLSPQTGTIQVTDDALWEKIKTGQVTGISVGYDVTTRPMTWRERWRFRLHMWWKRIKSFLWRTR